MSKRAFTSTAFAAARRDISRQKQAEHRRQAARQALPAGAEEACASCPDQRGCPNVTVCCGGQVTLNVVAPCPRGKW